MIDRFVGEAEIWIRKCGHGVCLGKISPDQRIEHTNIRRITARPFRRGSYPTRLKADGNVVRHLTSLQEAKPLQSQSYMPRSYINGKRVLIVRVLNTTNNQLGRRGGLLRKGKSLYGCLDFYIFQVFRSLPRLHVNPVFPKGVANRNVCRRGVGFNACCPAGHAIGHNVAKNTRGRLLNEFITRSVWLKRDRESAGVVEAGGY